METKESVGDFTKIIRIGRDITMYHRPNNGNIFCKIQYKNGKLSISGVVGPNRHGGCSGSCGQIDMGWDHRDKTLNDPRYSEPLGPKDIRFAPGWTEERFYDFSDIWAKYHLNDMKAGCEHQRELGWEKDGYEKHPSEPCPVCGYRYGTAWKTIQVPPEVLSFLVSLPDTDIIPAWV